MYKPIDMDNLKLNNNFKWVVTKDNFFTKEECEYIIEKADKYSERKKTKYFEQEDSICLLNIKKTNEQKYLDKFWEAISIANQVHYNYDIKGIYRNRIQCHRYDVGDWYNPHSDFYPIDQFSSLKLTCIVSLNDDYEGGDVQFGIQDKDTKEWYSMNKLKGSLTLFPAFLCHNVVPVSKGKRYVIQELFIGDHFK